MAQKINRQLQADHAAPRASSRELHYMQPFALHSDLERIGLQQCPREYCQSTPRHPNFARAFAAFGQGEHLRALRLARWALLKGVIGRGLRYRHFSQPHYVKAQYATGEYWDARSLRLTRPSLGRPRKLFSLQRCIACQVGLPGECLDHQLRRVKAQNIEGVQFAPVAVRRCRTCLHD